MKRVFTVIAITIAVMLLSYGVSAAQTDTTNTKAKTFAGTQYFHIVDGPAEGAITANVLAGVQVDGGATRWYVGAEMADQSTPEDQGGIGPSLILVSDVSWFNYKGKPVVSVVGTLSYLDHAKVTDGGFDWGPWTGLGLLFHVSDEAKVTIGFKGTPTNGFIENLGFGPGLFVTEPEQQLVKIGKGILNVGDKVLGGLFE